FPESGAKIPVADAIAVDDPRAESLLGVFLECLLQIGWIEIVSKGPLRVAGLGKNRGEISDARIRITVEMDELKALLLELRLHGLQLRGGEIDAPSSERTRPPFPDAGETDIAPQFVRAEPDRAVAS